MELILASASPRRKELLETMGLHNFRIVKPDFDEGSISHTSPADLVEALSLGKATAVCRELADPDALILAADTVVALEDAILGKPRDELDAFRMLASLSDVRHQVYTGVTLRRGNKILTAHEVTNVTFRSLSEEEIGAYIATGEPMDKAGAYGIQGFGSLLVERLEGDYFNVMGLPVCRVGQMLREFGIDCLKEAEKFHS